MQIGAFFALPGVTDICILSYRFLYCIKGSNFKCGEEPRPLDPWLVVPDKSKYVDHQTLKLQENLESFDGNSAIPQEPRLFSVSNQSNQASLVLQCNQAATTQNMVNTAIKPQFSWSWRSPTCSPNVSSLIWRFHCWLHSLKEFFHQTTCSSDYFL